MSVTKESIRQKVWSYLEDNNIARFPRPVFHRIPNFKGAEQACAKLRDIDEFNRAKVVKVNPDKPQEHARFLVLEGNKTLLVPTPRLRNGLFNRINPPNGQKSTLRTCSTSQGVKNYSSPIGLNAKIKIDVIVIGSVAVDKKGHRVGKGEGFADLEYAMMVIMNAVNEDTLVITTLHDCQLYDELPEELFGEHDLTVDVIATPTQLIRCSPRLPKPKGVCWSLLTREKFNEIPILKLLRQKKTEEGKDTRLKDE